VTKNSDERTRAGGLLSPSNGNSPSHGANRASDMCQGASRGAAQGEGGATSAPLSPPGFLPAGYALHGVYFPEDGTTSLALVDSSFTAIASVGLGFVLTWEWTQLAAVRLYGKAWAHHMASLAQSEPLAEGEG
jgi:hypothetical protein